MQWAKTFGYYSVFVDRWTVWPDYKNNFHRLFGEESKTTIALFTCILLQPPRLRAFLHDLLAKYAVFCETVH